MAEPRTLTCSRTYPFPVEQAFDFTVAAPLPELFSRWFGPLPPVTSVDGPEPWGAPGLARTVHTADGGTMHEEMLTAERPVQFAYRLSRLTGAMGRLMSSVDGSWRFEPVGSGTRIEWRWVVHPTSRFASALLPAVARLWHGYATRALQRLEQLMVAGLA